jgi:hypothetical protein
VGCQGVSNERAVGSHGAVCLTWGAMWSFGVVGCSRKGLWSCAARRGAGVAVAVIG